MKKIWLNILTAALAGALVVMFRADREDRKKVAEAVNDIQQRVVRIETMMRISGMAFTPFMWPEKLN